MKKRGTVGMPEMHTRVLRHCRMNLVKDLESNDVLDLLLQERIIFESQYDLLQGIATRKQCASTLLDILPRRGPRALHVFIQALQDTQPHLAKLLNDKLREAMESDCTMYENDTQVLNAASLAAKQSDSDSDAEDDEKYTVSTGMGFKNKLSVVYGPDQRQSSGQETSLTAVVIRSCKAQGLQIPDTILDINLCLNKRKDSQDQQHSSIKSQGAPCHDAAHRNTMANEIIEPAEGMGFSCLQKLAVLNDIVPEEGQDPHPCSKANILLTGESFDLAVGDLVFVDLNNTSCDPGYIVVTDKICRSLLVSRQNLQLHGDPRRESWFFPLALSSKQAVLILNGMKMPGCFLVYQSTDGHSNVRYNLSLSIPSGGVKTLHICESLDQEFFIVSERTFCTVIDLVNYYKRQKGTLPYRLRRSPGELARPEMLLVKLEPHYVLDSNDLKVSTSPSCSTSGGHFGKMISGCYKEQKVAIKTIQNLNIPWVLDDFMEEARLSCSLHHPSILRYIGIVPEFDDPQLVSEFIDGGNLLDHLKGYMDADYDARMLLELFGQLLSALHYLFSDMQILHRDVARNILMTDGMQLKLCDFGMARQITEDVYVADMDEKVSVRWAAPEVLKHLHYSTGSDIWSAGVVLWEMFSGGSVPYNDLNNNSMVTQFIVSGKVLPNPDNCPEAIYTLMKECWNFKVDERPSVDFILEMIQSIYLSLVDTNGDVEESHNDKLRKAMERDCTMYENGTQCWVLRH